MKKPIVNPPVFDPANRTLDFSGTPSFDIRRLYGVTNIRTGQLIYSPIRPALSPANIAGAVITLSASTNGMLPGDPLFIQYNDGINDLPPNASTADRQDTGNTRLTEIRDAIKAQRVETIWTDDTGTRFIRQNNEGVISWTDLAGNASSPPGAGARPDYDSGLGISRSTWRATAAGTDFSAGDYLDHFAVTDGDAGDPVSNYWFNTTSGAKLGAAPSAASISPYSPLPDGAATAARQDTANTALAAVQAGIGAPADADPGSDTAAGSIIARLARLLGSITGLATLITTSNTKLEAIRALVAGSTVTADTAGTITAGGVATPVAANLTRQFVEITNTGANPLSYRWGTAATATAGHILSPGQSARYDSKVPTGALNLFSTGGTTFLGTTG